MQTFRPTVHHSCHLNTVLSFAISLCVTVSNRWIHALGSGPCLTDVKSRTLTLLIDYAKSGYNEQLLLVGTKKRYLALLFLTLSANPLPFFRHDAMEETNFKITPVRFLSGSVHVNRVTTYHRWWKVCDDFYTYYNRVYNVIYTHSFWFACSAHDAVLAICTS